MRRPISTKVCQFLEARGILNLFTFPRTYNENLVHKFYADLSPSVADPSSPHFFRFFIRGREILEEVVFPLSDYRPSGSEEVITVPFDVIVEAHFRTIRSIVLKASSLHIDDLHVSTALLEPVEYPAEALIFPPDPSPPLPPILQRLWAHLITPLMFLFS
ncbi:hypothetical protein Syun_022532 [Stephania yunnanensis]|uniref:Uncharacterized protein n=1 Tax=Stephania yunnanensis TaxID=152371 RepID=A0AAP0F764_9MAGN